MRPCAFQQGVQGLQVEGGPVLVFHAASDPTVQERSVTVTDQVGTEGVKTYLQPPCNAINEQSLPACNADFRGEGKEIPT